MDITLSLWALFIFSAVGAAGALIGAILASLILLWKDEGLNKANILVYVFALGQSLWPMWSAVALLTGAAAGVGAAVLRMDPSAVAMCGLATMAAAVGGLVQLAIEYRMNRR